MKIQHQFFIITTFSLLLFACTQKTTPPVLKKEPVSLPIPTTIISTPTTQSTNPTCDWIDKSDVVIKVVIPLEITPDTSYEAGFTYSKPDKPSLELRLARVARAQCDYRVGFNRNDFTNIAHANIAVWSYTNTIRQKIKNGPISVDFVDGLPSFGKTLEVEITQ